MIKFVSTAFIVTCLRYVSSTIANSDLCQSVCYCSRTTIKCVKPDTLASFPVLRSVELMKSVTSVFIRHQPKIEEIFYKQLKYYTSLEKLEIYDSGIRKLHKNAFQNNPFLTVLALDNNKIGYFPWQAADGLKFQVLSLKDNRLPCGCSIVWLKHYHLVTCFDSRDGRHKLIGDANIGGCEIPSVRIEPSPINVTSGDRIVARCYGDGLPKPHVQFINIPNKWNYTMNTNDGGVTFTIEKAKIEHNFVLDCRGENSVGRSTSATRIRVFSAPSIVSIHGPTSFFYHCLLYSVSGEPAPTVTWFEGRKRLRNNTNGYIIMEENLNLSTVSGCLGVLQPAEKGRGRYTLVASNVFGSVNRSVDVNFDTSNVNIHKRVNLSSGHFLWNNRISPSSKLGRHYKKYLNSLGTLKVTTDIYNRTDNEESTNIITSKVFIPLMVSLFGALSAFFVVLLVCRRRTCLLKLCGVQERSYRQSPVLHLHDEIPLTLGNIVTNPNYLAKPDLCNFAANIKRITRKNLEFVRPLGEGAFGIVYLGKWRSTELNDTIFVAIKCLKDSESDDFSREFESEVTLLSSLDHKNIIKFYGACTDSIPLIMIFEYMENGDLKNFLRYHGPDAPLLFKGIRHCQILIIPEQLHIAKQISDGMNYLATRHYIHRDLATRNCLVSDRLLVKISDFGMCRDIYSSDYYKIGGAAMLPVRWMAPESFMYRKFTIESDIWSTGVVLWEIFSYGKQPWFECSNSEVIQKVQNGDVLAQPRSCPDEVYLLMLACWKFQSRDRILMSKLHDDLEKICLSYPSYNETEY